ncbi:phage major capsid protein [Nocardia niigatensis]|uniref:phage major capsid protein n=1 Tax=Nocardia niigatensis TaxID=209249 RepID=UPI0002F0218E|nr:phage major capsid protein [Nocardia niigatensis]
MSKTLAEYKAELAIMRSEATELSTRADLSAEDADRGEYLVTAIEQHRAAIAGIEGRMSNLRDAAESGHIERGTPFTDDRRGNSQTDMAMRSIDAANKSGKLAAGGAETVEALVKTGTGQDRNWAQRWAIAAGSPAYERAFGKLLADPERGHMLFDEQEAAAFRAVESLKTEQRAMGIASGATGGFMVPLVLDPSVILTNSGSVNPLRQIARVVQTVGSQWRGVTSAGVTAEWTAEATEFADASPTLASPNIPVYKGDAFVPFSFELAMDGAEFIGELTELLVDAAEQLNAQAYTVGTGSGQPTGIVTALANAGGSTIVTGSGTHVLAKADLFALQNALPPRSQSKAAWNANLTTINSVRQFETTNGALEFPEARNNPPMLLGRSLHENSAMSGINAVAHNYIAIYGDFKQFVIVDRIGSTLEMVPHLFGANRRPNGQRGAILWYRTGSDITNANAFRMLDVPGV